MVPKWLTSYLSNYVINQWSTVFGPISNPSVFEVFYLVKYFGGFKYFISHDIKNRFKNAVTLATIILSGTLASDLRSAGPQPNFRNPKYPLTYSKIAPLFKICHVNIS